MRRLALAALVVLWTHGAGEVEWKPFQTFESLRECQSYGEELHRQFPAVASGWICLPDAIDPRSGR